ncbi:AAA family ATPase [Campylobacter concisus]|uniref:AAA family ATPase n=1 Tax=Campylobacter concisus TaxID=199 RepID=UPI0011E61485|nr:AAA family ATPase [Campylobacter concisus]
MLEFFEKDWSQFSRIKGLENDKLFPHHACKVYLCYDNWDDFGYKTLYQIVIFDISGKKYDLGYVKIASFGQKQTKIPPKFESLGSSYFSLGQSPEYYSLLSQMSAEIRDIFLASINDVIKNEELLNEALSEDVFTTSLLRDTSLVTIRGQYKRILDGGAILDDYSFGYETSCVNNQAGYKLYFEVFADSNPPTNIHVLIGRNGVGKTHLLNNMTKSFIGLDCENGKFFEFEEDIFGEREKVKPPRKIFSRILSVSYSAFDPFLPFSEKKYPEYSYIGLKKLKFNPEESGTVSGEKNHLKDNKELSDEFASSFVKILSNKNIEQYKNLISQLESDPIFKELNIMEIIRQTVEVIMEFKKDDKATSQGLKQPAMDLFRKLSSGHAIILLTITKIFEKIEEKTLVLLDEPESHLHPPLLSSFMRALSDLLIKKNAVAIIATHSPVVLQEVPKSCVWRLSRFGLEAKAERFDIETFGETIGTLTKEIFGLEVNKSGFYAMLDNSVKKENGASYDSIMEEYNNQLGSEARLLVRALLNNRK